MKRLLAVVALLALLPNANAQDQAKGEMSHNGELRIRDSWYMNPAGQKNDRANQNDLTERFKLDLGFKASDKLAANVTLLNNFAWGRSGGDTLNTPDGSSSPGDFLTVNQAYATWMTSDDFTLKLGRMNYQIGDGTLIANNDWEAVPYAFEGVLGNYEAEFGRIQGFAFKFREYGTTTTTTSDAERNVYGLNFDLKTMPEMLKAVNVHLIKDNSDSVTGNTSNNVGRDILRYGLNANLVFSMVDLKVWYEGMSGKYYTVPATGDRTKNDATASMMQAEVGVNVPEFMTTRVFLKYHQDSGNKDDSSTSAKVQFYDRYFNEQHCSAGCMDLLDWGNLTFIQVGATMKPMDNTDVGINYWMLSRTEKGQVSFAGRGASGANARVAFSGGNADKSKIGDEIDLWAEHHYNSNLSTTFRLGQFMPGDYYKANGGLSKDNITQVFLEGKMTF